MRNWDHRKRRRFLVYARSRDQDPRRDAREKVPRAGTGWHAGACNVSEIMISLPLRNTRHPLSTTTPPLPFWSTTATRATYAMAYVERLPADTPWDRGVCDTPELWRGAAGLCARVRACAGAAESVQHTYPPQQPAHSGSYRHGDNTSRLRKSTFRLRKRVKGGALQLISKHYR